MITKRMAAKREHTDSICSDCTLCNLYSANDQNGSRSSYYVTHQERYKGQVLKKGQMVTMRGLIREQRRTTQKKKEKYQVRTFKAQRSMLMSSFSTECLFHIKGAFPIDTEIPGDTWEASSGEHWFGGYMCPNPFGCTGNLCVQTGNQCSFTGQQLFPELSFLIAL